MNQSSTGIAHTHAGAGQETDLLSILVVEDDSLVAALLQDILLDCGCAVVGPAGSVASALALIEREGLLLDGAFLDINLHHELVYPVADALLRLSVPFVFATGNARHQIDPRYAAIPALSKPFLPGAIDGAVHGFDAHRRTRLAAIAT